jgi:Ca-activated chloride channel family protein
MLPKKPNFYALLGLFRSAKPDEIRRAYLKSAKKLHPDKNQAAGETELFLDVQQAYQILSDPQRRAAYDATLPVEASEAGPKSPLECKIEISRPNIPSGNDKQLIYALLRLSTGADYKQTQAVPPLNVCLALDCSTSMQGPKMEMAQASAVQVLRRLKPDDIFSLVSFGDKAEVAIPAARQIDVHRAEIRVRALTTGGGTEMYTGLKAALDEVRLYNNPGAVNHVILLTDGRTYGDEEKCYAEAKVAADEGIGISGMGLGSGWNDVFLDHLADLTGGGTMFVREPHDIERFLSEKFNNLSRAFAQNVEFYAEVAEGAQVNYVFRIQPDAGQLSFQEVTRLGPVLLDEPLAVLFELRLDGERQNGQSFELLKGHIEASIASILAPVPIIPVRIDVTVDDSAEPVGPPQAIVQALSKLTLYRIQEKARLAVEAGDYEKATQHLQRLATHLLSQGEKSLARTILLEAQHIEQQKSFTDGGEKHIKYATRSLLMPGERIS